MELKEIADHALPKLLALPEEQAKAVLTNLLEKVYKEGYQRGLKDFHARFKQGQ